MTKVIHMEDNHIVGGTWPITKFREGMTLTSVNAEPLTFHNKSGHWYINDAMILDTEIPSRNGTVHIIDTVLVPANY